MTFIAFILHIWLLAVLPIIAMGRYIFRKDDGHQYLKSLSEPLLLVTIIAAIIAIFSVLAFSFLIARFYLNRADMVTGVRPGEKTGYAFMVFGTLGYFLMIHFFMPETLLGECAEAGIISMISQHGVLNIVYMVLVIERVKPGGPGKYRHACHCILNALLLLVALVVSARLFFSFMMSERSLFWQTAFHVSLISSTAGSFRFFYVNRLLLWEIRYG